MSRKVLLALLAVTACGSDPDQRPVNVQYITEAILAPTCSGAQCHSSFAQQGTDVFDSVDGVRHSILGNGLVKLDTPDLDMPGVTFDPSSPEKSQLILWLTQPLGADQKTGRMPFDEPMPNADIKLLESWIGKLMPGAQCDPDPKTGLSHGRGCRPDKVTNPDGSKGFAFPPTYTVVSCTAEYNFGDSLHQCAGANEIGDCNLGECACAANYGDCNFRDATAGSYDGCETSLDSNANCGGCTLAALPDGTGAVDKTCKEQRQCSAKGTGFACECPIGTLDCTGGTGDPDDCEATGNTDAQCGACGKACSGAQHCGHPSATTQFTCGCPLGTLECTDPMILGAVTDDCETDGKTVDNCGQCRKKCAATETCALNLAGTGYACQ